MNNFPENVKKWLCTDFVAEKWGVILYAKGSYTRNFTVIQFKRFTRNEHRTVLWYRKAYKGRETEDELWIQLHYLAVFRQEGRDWRGRRPILAPSAPHAAPAPTDCTPSAGAPRLCL